MTEKTTTNRLICILLTLLMLVVGAFYGICYPYHLRSMEFKQLFLYTEEYLLQTISIPGGTADLIGRFLTQFFLFPWAGAAVMAVLFGLIYLLSCLVLHGTVMTRDKQPADAGRFLFWGVTALLPIRFIWMYACDENAMPATFVALILALLTAWGLRKISHPLIRLILALALLFPLYWMVGPLALVASLLLLVSALRERQWLSASLLLVATLCIPYIAYQWAAYPMDNLLKGIGYFRFKDVFFPHFWVGALCIVLLDVLAGAIRAIPTRLVSAGAFVLISVLTFLGVRNKYMPNMEVVMMYDDLAYQERWDEIIAQARQRMPIYPACVADINLALVMSGQMGDQMFSFYQPGVQALLPKYEMNFARPFASSLIYYKLCWTNMAQRLCFEAQEAIPDNEKSAVCYKRLAQTHLVRNDSQLALKYLTALTHTLFYRDWANETIELLKEPMLIYENRDYTQMRVCKYPDDYFFTEDIKPMLIDYCHSAQYNRVANTYLKALALLDNDLELFKHCNDVDENFLSAEQQQQPMAKYWEQAMALYLMEHNQHDEQNRYRIRPETVQQMQQFYQAYEAGMPKEQLRQYFGNTYWFYYVYNEAAKAPETPVEEIKIIY